MNRLKLISLKLGLGLALLLPLAVASQAEIDIAGNISADWRYFPQAADDPQQFDQREASLKLAPELNWQLAERDTLKLELFYRHSADDQGRSHGDIREAYWRHSGDDYDLTVGLSKVFWGVTESRHLVDVINQTDLLEDIDREDKLGQPMINLEWYLGNGQLGLYWLPRFREQDQLDDDSRLRLPIAISDKAEYQSGAQQNHQDIAIRYSFVAGDWDVGLAGFYGTSREPIYQLESNSNGPELVPYYEIMSQISIDAQLTTGAWLFKLEAITRDADSDQFAALVSGFEYTLYQLGGSAKDLGFIVEYLRDERSEQAPATLFDNDLFLGMRLAFNDIDDSSILIGTSIDADSQEYVFSIEAETRLSPQLVAEITCRWLESSHKDRAQTNSIIDTLDQDDFIEASLIWSF